MNELSKTTNQKTVSQTLIGFDRHFLQRKEVKLKLDNETLLEWIDEAGIEVANHNDSKLDQSFEADVYQCTECFSCFIEAPAKEQVYRDLERLTFEQYRFCPCCGESLNKEKLYDVNERAARALNAFWQRKLDAKKV